MQLGRGQGNGLEVRDGVGRWKFTSQGWEVRWEVVMGVWRVDRGDGFWEKGMVQSKARRWEVWGGRVEYGPGEGSEDEGEVGLVSGVLGGWGVLLG